MVKSNLLCTTAFSLQIVSLPEESCMTLMEFPYCPAEGSRYMVKRCGGHFLSSQVQCTVPEFTAHGQSWIWRRSADVLVFCNREAMLHYESVTPSLCYEPNSHLETKIITFILKSCRCTFLLTHAQIHAIVNEWYCQGEVWVEGK